MKKSMARAYKISYRVNGEKYATQDMGRLRRAWRAGSYQLKYIGTIIFFMLIFFIKRLQKRFNIRLLNNSGRNFLGRICVQHRGGAPLNLYKRIDFIRNVNCYGFLFKIYKHFRYSAYVGFIFYENGLISISIVVETVKPGDLLFSGRNLNLYKNYENAIGCTMPLKNISLFTKISNIEQYPYMGSTLVRAAGGKAIIIKIEENVATVKLQSNWLMMIESNCLATIGINSNILHNRQRIGKAGNKRRLGFRPTVRGVAKNPCDHPHGGGRGKSSPLRVAKTPWGKLSKGQPTKNKLKDRQRRRKFLNISGKN